MADTGIVPPAAASNDNVGAEARATADAPTPAGPPEEDDHPSMIGLARTLAGELPGLLSDRVHLFALELRRSGTALARMVAWAVAAAVVLTTAWLALWVGLGTAAIRAGWPWYGVLAAILLLNLAAAAFAVARARAMAPLLVLPATLRHLTLAPSARSHGEPLRTDVTAAPHTAPGALPGEHTLH